MAHISLFDKKPSICASKKYSKNINIEEQTKPQLRTKNETI